jgi:hypothetical protein
LKNIVVDPYKFEELPTKELKSCTNYSSNEIKNFAGHGRHVYNYTIVLIMNFILKTYIHWNETFSIRSNMCTFILIIFNVISPKFIWFFIFLDIQWKNTYFINILENFYISMYIKNCYYSIFDKYHCFKIKSTLLYFLKPNTSRIGRYSLIQ